MTPERLVLIAIVAAVLGSLISVPLSRWRVVAGWFAFLIVLATAALVMTAAMEVLAHGPSGKPERLLAAPRLGFSLFVSVDGLTAIFLVLAVVIAVPAALHSIAHMGRFASYGVGHYYPHLLFFVAAMYGLVSTTDMMWFLFIFWQMMTIPGYLLIRFEYRRPENVRAANRFLLMMQLGCAATMIGGEILAQAAARHASTGELKYSFDAVTAGIPMLLNEQPALAALAFGLFLVGFGVKTGMWPFGAIWLPEAHPAAPSPVSAVLSGVMIKTGVYGLLRYFLCLVPSSARTDFGFGTWGGIIAVIGTVTMVTGTTAALRQDYTKRLLAFHSIGQAGYILLACGTCMVLVATDNPELWQIAALALMAALLHSFNHGVFKALLFLNAGSMLDATGTQDLNRMGGLWRHMPLTAWTALTASMAIAGFPLLNGFVSKWMVYVAALRASPAAPYMAICAALALMTNALTLASFVKFFGTSFLGQSSAVVEAQVRERGKMEVGWLMQVPQLALAALCVITGIFPALLVWLADSAVAATHQGVGGLLATVTAIRRGPGFGVRLAADGAGYAPLAILGVLAAMALMAWIVSRLGGAQRRRDAPWLCGYATGGDEVRYTAHGFYSELKRTWGDAKEGKRHGSA